jgi:hypothetical protein
VGSGSTSLVFAASLALRCVAAGLAYIAPPRRSRLPVRPLLPTLCLLFTPRPALQVTSTNVDMASVAPKWHLYSSEEVEAVIGRL